MIDWNKPVEYFHQGYNEWLDAEVVKRDFKPTANKPATHYLMVIKTELKDLIQTVHPEAYSTEHWRNKKEKFTKILAVYRDKHVDPDRHNVMSLLAWKTVADCEKNFREQNQLVLLSAIEVEYYA